MLLWLLQTEAPPCRVPAAYTFLFFLIYGTTTARSSLLTYSLPTLFHWQAACVGLAGSLRIWRAHVCSCNKNHTNFMQQKGEAYLIPTLVIA